LAQYCDFNSDFLQLLAPIIKVLEESPGFGKIQQCEELLNRVSTSLLKNDTVEGSKLLQFLYSIIDRGVSLAVKVKINDEKEKRDYGAKVDQEFTKRSQKDCKDLTM